MAAARKLGAAVLPPPGWVGGWIKKRKRASQVTLFSLLFQRLRDGARRLKREATVVYCVARHPLTPWWVRLLALAIAAYALSPIDLIPDFIPVLGYLDDVVVVPLGLALVVRCTPAAVLAECRTQAAALAERPTSRVAAVVIVVVWLACAAWMAVWLLRWW
jgi:uncharacterized membrane protein YkvA (DUF1232 family)